MAALWPVDDKATAELMGAFYAALAAGRSEAEALADAQRQMLPQEGRLRIRSIGRGSR